MGVVILSPTFVHWTIYVNAKLLKKNPYTRTLDFGAVRDLHDRVGAGALVPPKMRGRRVHRIFQCAGAQSVLIRFNS